MVNPSRPQSGPLTQSPALMANSAPGPSNGNDGRPPRRDWWLGRPVNNDGNTLGQLLRLLLFGLVLLIVLGAAVTPWNAVRYVDLPTGTVANRAIKAPRNYTYQSDVLTQEKREEAANAADRAFTRDPSVITRQRQEFDTALSRIDEIRTSAASYDERVGLLQNTIDGLSPEEAGQLLSLDLSRWIAVRNTALPLLDDVMQDNISPERVPQVREALIYRVPSSLSQDERQLTAALARGFVKANYFEDEARTRQNREVASGRVQPIRISILEGETIVRDGEIVTPLKREKLERLGLLQRQADWPAVFGTVGLVAILVVLLAAYLYQFNRDVWRGSQLILLGLVIVLPVVAGRITIGSQPVWIYAFPVAAAVMLTTVLLNLQLATVVAMMVSILLGLLGGWPSGSLEYMVIAFVASLVGAFVVWQADRIVTFLWSGVAVGVAVFAVGACFHIASGGLSVANLLQIAMLAALNGGLSAVLTFGSFSFLGGIFGITTHLQLLELAHPNQPLLYKLAREAPGTYHHSIVVSNLAESAVELVGGDPLFTRVAVLYHDIGKTLRPTFFIENQANRENVHDVLDPQQSARIIIDHVTDGVRLAQKARLPGPIVDIIRQHHGTMLIRYFYNRALEQGEEVREEDFRYPGPRPQTKEAGVIMLADSVEAAVRAAAQSGKLNFQDEPRVSGPDNGHAPAARGDRQHASKLQELVEQVIEVLVKSNQLDECDLTLRDIDRIKRTFVQVLDGIYHPRIEYPTAPVRRSEEAVAGRA